MSRKRLIKKPCFELAAKGVFRLGRTGKAFPGFEPATRNIPRLNSSQLNRLVLDLPTPEGWKAELT